MLEHGGLRIFSANPIRDRAGIYRERAGAAWDRAKKRIERAVEKRLDNVSGKISRIIEAEWRAEKEWARISGKDAKDAGWIGAFEIFIMTKWQLENPGVRILDDEFALPKPPRGAVMQDARGWYSGNGCGAPRYPAMTGTSAVHDFNIKYRGADW